MLSLSAKARLRRWAPWILWGVFILTVTVLVVHDPDARSATRPYQHASNRWWAGEDLYRQHGVHGFLYFPQFAIFYTLFTFPGKTIGEALWRWFSLGLFASAVWRLANLVRNGRRQDIFLLTTLLCLPAALASARDGQSNMPLSALMIHAGVDLAQCHWTRSALLLAFCIIMKPIALPLLLLAFAFYPSIRLRLALCVLAVIVLPFMRTDWPYVWRQHLLCLNKLIGASEPPEHFFCDFYGALQTFGIFLPFSVIRLIRAAAALATLVLAWIAHRPPMDPKRYAVLLVSLNACFLLLFNPKTETNSYVILSPIIAVFAAECLIEHKWKESLFLALLALGLGVDNYGTLIHRATDLWFKAVIAAVFLGYLIRLLPRPAHPGLPAEIEGSPV